MRLPALTRWSDKNLTGPVLSRVNSALVKASFIVWITAPPFKPGVLQQRRRILEELVGQLLGREINESTAEMRQPAAHFCLSLVSHQGASLYERVWRHQPAKPPFGDVSGTAFPSFASIFISPLTRSANSFSTPGIASDTGASFSTIASKRPCVSPGVGTRFSKRLGTPGGKEIVSY